MTANNKTSWSAHPTGELRPSEPPTRFSWSAQITSVEFYDVVWLRHHSPHPCPTPFFILVNDEGAWTGTGFGRRWDTTERYVDLDAAERAAVSVGGIPFLVGVSTQAEHIVFVRR